MLTVEHLSVSLPGQSLLRDISFTLTQGKTLCIIGESGAGKSTLIRSLQGLMPITAGRITLKTSSNDTAIYQPSDHWHGLPHVQWVMQNPLAALNPKQQVGAAILESIYHTHQPLEQQKNRLSNALADVQLAPDIARRYPDQLSIGQAQRVCIARALISRPAMILFDEPLSSLDAIVQKQIARTMHKIKGLHSLSYIVVTHDLGYASAYADEILLLRQGIVEAYQPVTEFFNAPKSDYAMAMIQAATLLGALPANSQKKLSALPVPVTLPAPLTLTTPSPPPVTSNLKLRSARSV